MTRDKLIQLIRDRKSYLCVGLDSDLDLIPTHLLKEADPIFAFNKAIIDATKDFCVATKSILHFMKQWVLPAGLR